MLKNKALLLLAITSIVSSGYVPTLVAQNSQPSKNTPATTSTNNNAAVKSAALQSAGHALWALPVEIKGEKGCLMVDTGAADLFLWTSKVEKFKFKTKPSTRKVSGFSGGIDNVLEGTVSIKVPGQSTSAFSGLNGKAYFLPFSLPITEVPGFVSFHHTDG